MNPSPTVQQPEAPAPFPRKKAAVEIDGWRVRLYYWTRNPHLLFLLAALIIGAGVLLGKLWEAKEPGDRLTVAMAKFREQFRSQFGGGKDRVDLAAELLKAKPDIGRVLAALPACNSFEESAVANVTRGLQVAALPEAEKNLALAYWQSLCSQLGEPGADLLYFACQPKPPAHANELVGDFLVTGEKKAERALQHYEHESPSPRRTIRSAEKSSAFTGGRKTSPRSAHSARTRNSQS